MSAAVIAIWFARLPNKIRRRDVGEAGALPNYLTESVFHLAPASHKRRKE
jgi:hypothetical protein